MGVIKCVCVFGEVSTLQNADNKHEQMMALS